MGISGYLPSSRISQAGVVADTANRPSSPYEGQVLYQKDTNQLLVYDGSAWVMIADTDQPPGLQLIKTQTIGTTVSSVEVTSAFSSEFDNYKITVTGGGASANDNMTMKLGSSTTGYYDSVLYNASNALNTSSATGTANTGSSWARVGASNTDSIHVNIDLLGPNLAKYTSFSGQYTFYGTTVNLGYITGMHLVAAAYTSFTLAPGSGTMTGGTIRVYGYRNS